MKKFIVLAMSVLFSTLVFAYGTEDPSTGSSSVVVLSSNGSSLFKVLYKSQRSGNVKISILNERQEVIFSETIRKKDSFLRPYNFDGLPQGSYTIEVEDESGKQIERVNYGRTEVQPLINLTKLAGSVDKYLLTGHFQTENEIYVRIYDSTGELVFDESRKVNGQFGEVYNLKNLPASFTLEVADSQGVLKSMKY